MKTKLTLAGVAAVLLLFTWTSFGQTNTAAIPLDRVSVYRVPLVCPAAPQIGCGSHAKPVLLAFEREPTVAEAWLNRAGTLLTLIWNSNTSRSQRSAAFKRVSKTEGLEATELKGAEKKEALKEFPKDGGWLHGKDVDRLSEEEAGILAQRLVRKVRSIVSLTDQQAKSLLEQTTGIITRRLTGELFDRSSAENEILKVLRQELGDQDASRLEQALKDYRPGNDAP